MKRPGPATPPPSGWGDVGGPVEPLEILEAVVHSGGVATPYLRCGRGPPLLFLPDPRAGDVRCDPVLRTLALGFLVIVPLHPGGLPDDPSASLAWIPPFLEGLGLESPGIVIRRCLD